MSKAQQVDTRTRLKRAARGLIAQKGVEAVGIREIMQVAGVRNASAVGYHFGSKQGLISELVQDIFDEVRGRWRARLGELKTRGDWTVRDIVTIIIEETRWSTINDPQPTVVRFLAAVLAVQHRSAAGMLLAEQSPYNLLMREIVARLPHIPSGIMRQRLVFFSWYLLSTLSILEAHLAGPASPQSAELWGGGDVEANIIETASAILQAPIPEHRENRA
ncbi:TetR/AcrR family transcriptional regulator [Sphingomonas colocasiae]|uniref:TetR/AcrR family transcriptional regulator n=1 Tax=Sphingomonas colocasiae TaxID=1848973 RepID=A0ABS7PU92_9SPHN|nr:TetR/AcrR family transcriptional regulator [Sphingomonas colocasiae]MBY8824918.1 TetR/AcrR family transcriptional regulator [Sphingomonas colocasiae]